MGADYNVPDKSESQRIIGFCFRILVAVIVNLVVIPQTSKKSSILFSSSCITLCPAGSDKIVIEKSLHPNTVFVLVGISNKALEKLRNQINKLYCE
jgi:hypothetical protein